MRWNLRWNLTSARRVFVACTGLVVVVAGAVVATPAFAADTTPETAAVARSVPFSAGEGYRPTDPQLPATDKANRAVAEACAGGQPVYRPHWVRFTPSKTTTIRPEASLTRSETDYSAPERSGVAVLDSNLGVVDCDSGVNVQTAGPVTVQAGSTVYVMVFALAGPCEFCSFSYDALSLLGKQAAAPPVNDDWENATPITSLPFSQSVDVSSATPQDADRVNVGGCSADFIQNARTVWWRFTPLVSGPLRIPDGSFAFAKLTDHGPEYFDDCDDGIMQPPVFEYGTTYLIQGGVPQNLWTTPGDYVGLGGPVNLSVSADGPTRAARSDLVVTKVSVLPVDPRAGQALRFAARVRNVGLASTPGGVTHGVKFFVDGQPVSASSTWDASLAQGESVTLTANATPDLPAAWLATAGTHTVRAYVDDQKLIQGETSEVNNTRTVPLSVERADVPQKKKKKATKVESTRAAGSRSLPDVVVTHVTWSPRSPAPGAPVTFRATVRNIGTRSTPGGTPVRVSFRPDGSATGAPFGTGGRLRPGQKETVTASGTWAPVSGSNRIVARLDALNTIDEANENNNTTEVYLTTT